MIDNPTLIKPPIKPFFHDYKQKEVKILVFKNVY